MLLCKQAGRCMHMLCYRRAAVTPSLMAYTHPKAGMVCFVFAAHAYRAWDACLSNVRSIVTTLWSPATAAQVMDNLWKASSNGKFGYSVQREIFNQQSKQWPKFFKRIDWTTTTEKESVVYRKWPGEFTYTVDAPRGHLPLTNALRGTQLFQALLEHPAFEKSANAKKSIDDITKEQTAAGNKLLS